MKKSPGLLKAVHFVFWIIKPAFSIRVWDYLVSWMRAPVMVYKHIYCCNDLYLSVTLIIRGKGRFTPIIFIDTEVFL